MAKVAKERTVLQRVLDTLPRNHTALRDAQTTLAGKGTEVTRGALYEVVKGRSKNPELIEAILDAAEASKARAAALAARADRLQGVRLNEKDWGFRRSVLDKYPRRYHRAAA